MSTFKQAIMNSSPVHLLFIRPNDWLIVSKRIGIRLNTNKTGKHITKSHKLTLKTHSFVSGV